ncbi:MAG: SLC13 family permease [Pseudomonadota bacterium]
MGGELALTQDMMMVLAVLGVTIALFVFELLRVDVVAICVMVALGLLGLVPSSQLFNGFASNAVISIIAVMIIGAGLDRTGVMGVVASGILKIGGKTEARILPLVSATVGAISGFMQNVGATALFLPVVSRIATRSNLPLGRLLMPMGFCAIMGGTVTMVGSSPLILLNDLIENSNRNLPPGAAALRTYELFDVTPIGLALITAGIIYFLVLGRFLLPTGGESKTGRSARTQNYFAETYGVSGDIYELVVTSESPLVGLTVGEAEEDPAAPFFLAIRNGDDTHMSPEREEMIWVGTVLGVMGPRSEVREYAERNELNLRPRLRNFGNLFNPTRAGISEVVIAPGSKLIGKTLEELRFRKRYSLSVLAVFRGEEVYRRNARKLPLQVGDTLVIHSFWGDLAKVARDRDFVVVTDLPTEEQRPNKVGWAILFLSLAIGMILFTDFRLSICLLVGAMGMVLTGVLNIDEAYAAVSWKTVFLLASLIPLGLAMDTTGTAAWIAQETVNLLGDVPQWEIQLVLALLTTFFTLVMSNVGATTLLVPLAINIAIATGGDPGTYALIVGIAASNAFLIPTHQVSALIMGPGGYRVTDFMKVGGIMTIIFLVVMLVMINLFYN